MIPAAEAATVEARLRAPRETKRGAAARSFMNDRRLFCSSLSGDMVSFPTAAKSNGDTQGGETGIVKTLELAQPTSSFVLALELGCVRTQSPEAIGCNFSKAAI